jgi:DNA-binding beta-propeller fold protein YncE
MHSAFTRWFRGATVFTVMTIMAALPIDGAWAWVGGTLEPAAPLAEFVREVVLGADAAAAAGGVAVAADGTLYVIDSLADQIRVFDRAGTPVATWGERGTGPGQFQFRGSGNFWGDLALGPDDHLYVADTFNHRVQVLAPDGTFLREWGEKGSENGQFNVPAGIAVDAAGRVYVTDGLNARLQVFESDGTFRGAWAPPREGDDPFLDPADVAVDAAGIVWVTDHGSHKVSRFGSDGVLTGVFGGFGSEPGKFAGPWGIAADAQGNLFVADYLNDRIQVLAPDGAPQGTLGSNGEEPGEFRNPIYLTVGPDGLLYVADETNRRVQVFRLLPPLGAATGTPASA